MTLRSLWLCGVLVSFPVAVQADSFLLSDGGRIDGQWLNVDEKPQTKYTIRAANGATLTLAKESVKQVVKQTPAEIEYETVRHQQPDTVAGHTALAQWCLDQKLTDQRKLHLERVLEIDPNNISARSVLGYVKLGGQWRTREQHLSSMGKVQVKGEWMYPQEIEILERKAEAMKARMEWVSNIKKWRTMLNGDKEATARANIAAIRDPAAFPAILDALQEEKVVEVRVMYARALARMGTYDAKKLIAELSLLDVSDEVRAICLELLEEAPEAFLANFYIQQLQSKDNVILNRAAYALARFKEPRAVGPLIDVLVTTHKYEIISGGSGMSVTNSSTGSGMSMGQSKKIVQETKQNQQVLDTLLTLVKNEVNYTFDVNSWRNWYAGQKRTQFVDARRSQ